MDHLDPMDGLAQRVASARELLAERAFCGRPGALFVFASTPGVAGYQVIGGRCTCSDATVGFAARHLDGRCKHALLAGILNDQELVARANERRLRDEAPPAWLARATDEEHLGFKPERRRSPMEELRAEVDAHAHGSSAGRAERFLERERAARRRRIAATNAVFFGA